MGKSAKRSDALLLLEKGKLLMLMGEIAMLLR
jgi:hypothetical protein